MSATVRITVGEVIQRFLIDQRRILAPASYKWYNQFLSSFARKHGETPIPKLKATTLTNWALSYPEGSQHNAARTVIRALNWAVAEKLIVSTPLPGFRKPTATKRDSSVTPAQYAACLKAATPPLRIVIKFLYHTGCRPQELRAIEARWIDGSKITLPREKSKGKKKCRVIYLDDMSRAIAHRLAADNPKGPIFRGEHNRAWSRDGLGQRFRRLRGKIGVTDLCAYSFRHAFITRLLERGVDVPTVAALAGNTPKMVLEIYNHVSHNESRLLATLCLN